MKGVLKERDGRSFWIIYMLTGISLNMYPIGAWKGFMTNGINFIETQKIKAILSGQIITWWRHQ